jgi:heme oxygenase (biliverdin-producing, ferredoxin)
MPPEIAPGALSDAMRERTRSLHAEAERSGIVADIMHQRASRYGYALLLRNLLPVYARMERRLEGHRHATRLAGIARPEIYRAAAIAADLDILGGRGWRRSLPLLPAGERYARRIAVAARGNGARLAAHAYTRYLGDLSGGQILQRLLIRSLGLDGASLSFLDFSSLGDQAGFKAAYRAALDAAALAASDRAAVLDEAVLAFRLNIALSIAVQQAAARRDRSAAIGDRRADP